MAANGEMLVSLRIKGDGSGLTATLQSAQGEIDKFAASAQRGGDSASRSFDKAKSSADGLNNTLIGLRTAALSLVGIDLGAGLVRDIAQTIDSYTNLSARIRLTTSSAENFAEIQKSVFDISQLTGTALEDNAKVYQRLEQVIQRSGTDQITAQTQALSLTKEITEAIIVSGVSTQEASRSIMDFVHGLGGGVVHAQQLRPIMRQFPYLVGLMADGLGVSSQRFEELVHAGIPAQDLLRALASQAGNVDAAFATMPVTFARAWQELANAFTVYIGKASEASSVSALIKDAIIGIAHNLDTVTTGLEVVGAAFALNLGSRALVFLVPMATELGAAAAGMYALAEAEGVAAAASATLAAGFEGVLALIGGLPGLALAAAGGLVYLATRGSETSKAMDDLSRITDQLEKSQGNLTKSLEDSVNKQIAEKQALLDTAQAKLALAEATATAEIASGQYRAGIGPTTTLVNMLRDEVYKLTGGLGDLNVKLDETKEMQTKLAMNADIIAAFHRQGDDIKSYIQSLDAQTDKINDQIDAYGKNTSAVIRHSVAQHLAKLALDESVPEFKAQADAIRRSGDEAITAAQKLEGLQYAHKHAGDAAKEAAKSLDDFDKIIDSITVDKTASEMTRLAAAMEEAERRGHPELIKALSNALEKLGIKADEARIKHARLSDEFKHTLDPVQELIKKYDDEAKMIGLTDDQRTIMQAQLEAEKVARAALDKAIQENNISYVGHEQEIIAQAQARAVGIVQLEKAAAAERDYQNIVINGANSMADALAGFATRSIKSLKDLWKSLADSAKQMVAQIISEFLKLNVIKPLLTSIFSGGAISFSQAASASGAGGFGQLIGSLGGGNGGGLLGGLGGLFGGGASAGFNLAGNAAAGGIDLAAPSFGGFGSLGLGSTSGAASSGGLFSGLGGLATTVGLVVAGASLLNSIIGGGLFGTSWKPSGSTTNVGIGPAGSSITNTIDESRKAPLFGLFGGSTHKQVSGAIDPTTAANIQALFDTIKQTVASASNALGVEIPNIISGSFKQVYDKNGTLKSQLSSVLGQTFKESIDDFQKRITAENILSVVMQQATDASSIAEQWRSSASALLDGSQFLLAAQADIHAGTALLSGETLTQVTDFVQGLKGTNENLTQTYARLQADSIDLKTAMDGLGVNLGKTGEDFVKFSADLVTAAGGLTNIDNLWKNYYSGFYASAEQASKQLEALLKTSRDDLASLGLSPDITKDAFRKLFEQLMPTFSPEQLVQWLRAAQALNDATTAQAAYNQQLADASSALRKAQQDYKDFIDGFRVEAGSESSFEKTMSDINQFMTDSISKANDLARAAGLQGASEEDLSLIHEVAAHRAAQAISELEKSTTDLINQLGLSTDTQAVFQSASDSFTNVASSASEAASASKALYDAQINAIKQVRQFLDSLLLNQTLTTLTPEQQLREAARQYEATLTGAKAGDPEALSHLTQAAQSYLDIARKFYSSNDQYTAIFDGVRNGLEAFANTKVNEPSSVAGGSGVFSGGGSSSSASSSSTAIDPLQRSELLHTLLGNISDLIHATGQPLSDLVQSLHLDLPKFITDLGVNLASLNTGGTQQLADIARSLGIKLPDLAEAVGANIGQLTDKNSFISQALQQRIDGLPQGDHDKLAPLFYAVENATNQADANEAIRRLTDLTNTLPASERDLLAPFLSGVKPGGPLDNLDHIRVSLDSINDGIQQLLVETITQNQKFPIVINPPPPDITTITVNAPPGAPGGDGGDGGGGGGGGGLGSPGGGGGAGGVHGGGAGGGGGSGEVAKSLRKSLVNSKSLNFDFGLQQDSITSRTGTGASLLTELSALRKDLQALSAQVASGDNKKISLSQAVVSGLDKVAATGKEQARAIERQTVKALGVR